MPYAFRCRNCGRLVGPEWAGERAVPYACPVCKRGVRFTPSGDKTYEPDNWEVLADATPEQLDRLGLTADEVVRHTPLPYHHHAKINAELCRQNLAAIARKRAHWDANKDAIVAEFNQLDAEIVALDKQIAQTRDDFTITDLSNKRDKLWQRLHDLANLEPTSRDAEHELHLRAQLERFTGNRGGESTKPQTLQVRARDGSRAASSVS